MVVDQSRGKKKATGKTYVRKCPNKKKRKYASGRNPSMTGISKKQVSIVRTLGGNKKVKLLRDEVANVYDSKAKKFIKAKINAVVENPANRNFVRRNIITKGSVIDTEAGKARVTSRPGQDGTINAVLV